MCCTTLASYTAPIQCLADPHPPANQTAGGGLFRVFPVWIVTIRTIHISHIGTFQPGSLRWKAHKPAHFRRQRCQIVEIQLQRSELCGEGQGRSDNVQLVHVKPQHRERRHLADAVGQPLDPISRQHHSGAHCPGAYSLRKTRQEISCGFNALEASRTPRINPRGD